MVESKITPLLTFLRAFLSKEDRKGFAERCGTTEVYLYQLAAQPYPNPRLRLAKALVRESKLCAKKMKTSPLTLDCLLIGAADEQALVEKKATKRGPRTLQGRID